MAYIGEINPAIFREVYLESLHEREALLRQAIDESPLGKEKNREALERVQTEIQQAEAENATSR